MPPPMNNDWKGTGMEQGNRGYGYEPQYPPQAGSAPMNGTQQMPPVGYGTQQVPPAGYGTQQMPPAGYGTQQMPPAGYGTQQMPPVDDGTSSEAPVPPMGTQELPINAGGNPPPARRPARKKRLSLFQKAVILCAVGFVAWYLYINFAPSAATYGTVEAGMLGANYTGDALIVRNETPYEAEGVTSINYTAEEGKICPKGQEICSVYSSGYSTRESANLQTYRDSLRDYELTLLDSSTTYDAKLDRLNSDVLAAAREVREIVADGGSGLTAQQEVVTLSLNARQTYLNQLYATDQRFSRLVDDVSAQHQRILSWTKQYEATSNDIVSFYTDGYEYGINMTNYLNFTPAEVRAMVNGRVPDPISTVTSAKSKSTIYRTVTDGQWAVLMLVDDTSWNPVEGQQYQLVVERFENTQVTATVMSFTRSGGELLVRLLVEDEVTPVLYMRSCQVTLGDEIATMRVPARALYEQNGMQGVVVVNGDKESFVPVNVIYDAGSYLYVTSTIQGLLFEGQTVLLF